METAVQTAPTAPKLELVKPKREALSPQQHQAIVRILEGASNKEIAEELEVHYETVLRWRRQKMFARELAKEADKVSETAMKIMQANMTHATQRMIEMIDDPKATRTQLTAAMAVVKIVLESKEIEKLNAELRELEAQGTNR